MKNLFFKGIIFTCLLFCCLVPAAQQSKEPGNDRWLEIDLYWFNKNDINGSAAIFWQRFHPFFKDINGWKGVILNVGWLTDHVLEWRGNLSDVIPIVNGITHEKRFLVEGNLKGSVSDKYKQWRKRFEKPADHQVKNYEQWTYNDLALLADALRNVAWRNHSLNDIKIGSFVLGWKYIYGSSAAIFSINHPEAFSPFSRRNEANATFDVTALLKKDKIHYGAFPKGIPEGLPITRFFGEQWGDMSKKVGLDAIVLRDGMIGPGCYSRWGPYGNILSSDTALNEKMINAHADLVRFTKKANSNALVIGYSSAGSAVGDLRTNAFDLEKIAGEGFLDAYIDQTWGGAWNEIGIRYAGDDLWTNPAIGWTHQLAFMLVHAAVLAGTNTRHYQLTETFDAWESWDVIHTSPERLKWGIWAYSHAAVKTPNGLQMPDGAYISWCNQGTRLLTEKDVEFLSTSLNEAYSDAAKVKEVFGPTLVYNRKALLYQNQHSPDKSIKEWIDEYAGNITKWGLPILSITRSEWLENIKTDLPVLQTPVQLSDKERNYISGLMDKGKALTIIGSPAGGVDPVLAKKAGLISTDTAGTWRRFAMLPTGNKSSYTKDLDTIFATRQFATKNTASNDVSVLYLVTDTLPGNDKTEIKIVLDNYNDYFWDYVNLGNPVLITAEGNREWLADRKPLAAVQDYAKLTSNTNLIGDPVRLGGKLYEKGIGLHASAEVVYQLEKGKFMQFHTVIGLDDAEGRNGEAHAKIYLNGELKYQRMLYSNNMTDTVSFPIPVSSNTAKANPSPVLVKTKGPARNVLSWDPPEYKYDYGKPVLNLMGGSVEPFVITARAMHDMLKGSSSPYLNTVDPYKTFWMGAWQLEDSTYRLLTADLEEGIRFTPDQANDFSIRLPLTWGTNFTTSELWKKGKEVNSTGKLDCRLEYTESKLYKISTH